MWGLLLLTLDPHAPPHPAFSLPKEGQEKEEDREDLSASENWTLLNIQWMKDLYFYNIVWSTTKLPAQR